MNAQDFANYTWPEDTPRTNTEFNNYPQISNDHFGYRMVRIQHAWKLELENNKLRKALEAAEKEFSRLFTILPIAGPLPLPDVMQEVSAALVPE